MEKVQQLGEGCRIGWASSKPFQRGQEGKRALVLPPKYPEVRGMLRDVQEGLSVLTLLCHMHTHTLPPLGDDFSECSLTQIGRQVLWFLPILNLQGSPFLLPCLRRALVMLLSPYKPL